MRESWIGITQHRNELGDDRAITYGTECPDHGLPLHRMLLWLLRNPKEGGDGGHGAGANSIQRLDDSSSVVKIKGMATIGIKWSVDVRSCVNIVQLGFKHHPSLEQVKAGPSIALAFDQLEAIDLSFQLPIVPCDR